MPHENNRGTPVKTLRARPNDRFDARLGDELGIGDQFGRANLTNTISCAIPTADFASAFLAKLLATRTARPNQPFAGYAPYCRDVVQAFFERSERAFSVVTA